MNMHPHLLADQQTFEVQWTMTWFQEYMQQLAPKIEAHLQEKLHNRKIRMTTRVSEANENVRAYSHAERFQMMSKEKPQSAETQRKPSAWNFPDAEVSIKVHGRRNIHACFLRPYSLYFSKPRLTNHDSSSDTSASSSYFVPGRP